MRKLKIISGGQTGVDQLGLLLAKAFSLETGGYAPKNYRTEVGRMPVLLKQLGLVECDIDSYKVRTVKNVKISDLTVLFGNTTSAGTKDTVNACVEHKIPTLVNPSANKLIAKLEELFQSKDVVVINVAGNRQSKLSKEDQFSVQTVLSTVFNAFISDPYFKTFKTTLF